MKHIYRWLLALVVSCSTFSCTNLDEEVFDRVNADIYYQDETSVKGAVAAIYSNVIKSIEYYWYLQEFSADQIAWRTWNGGGWGWDEAEKYVLSSHTWTSESKIIRQSWENAWTTIGLCNQLINDLQGLNPSALMMTQEAVDSYIAEVRTLRAWTYYNNFELWGGALPLNISSGSDVPGSASADFGEGCQIIYDFIAKELDEACPLMLKEDGSGKTRNRMNQAANRMIKMRLLLNSEVFVGKAAYTECATLAQDILEGDYGVYELAKDYRDIYSIDNAQCSEVVMALAYELGKVDNGNLRNTPFLAYNFKDYCNASHTQYGGWNCTCLAPSYDNSGTVLANGGSEGAVCFLDAPYNDKLGAVYERFHDKDIRKQNYVYDEGKGEYQGMFLKGLMKANYGKGDVLPADADRQDAPLDYVDQVGTFLGLGRALETVMSPRWGETNSGVRLIKYPIYPESVGIDFADIDEVEFRLAEVVYTLAECKMRAGDSDGAKQLVNSVKGRYFTDKSALDTPGRGFTAFDMDWMLSEWGLEFLNEGRRRRTDLRRFDKFTQGQWWFFGRATEDGFNLPAQRDRKYEWYPLPASALSVNPGLVQNPNYN